VMLLITEYAARGNPSQSKTKLAFTSDKMA